MKIFEKRPLCMILCIMLTVFSLFVNQSTALSVIFISFSLVAIILLLIFKDKILKFPLSFISAIAILLSVCLSLLFNFLFYPTEYHEKEITLTATVEEIDHTIPEYTAATVKAEEIDGKRESYKLSLTASKDLLSGVNKGDKIKLKATLISSNCSEDEHTSSNLSEGVSGKLISISSCEILGTGSFNLLSYFEKAAKSISGELKYLTDKQTGGLISALLIGDKSDLDGNTSLNFSRIGISHILALSGMHLSILSALLCFLLRRLRLGKKIVAVTVSTFTLIFMALTGFTASVTRAGIMLIIYYVLYLFERTHDSLTNLSIAVSLIIIITPYSVYSLSLWLSAFATLGVICFSEINLIKQKKRDNTLTKIIKAVTIAFGLSCFANFATIFFTAFNFGKISLFSLFSTLIFSPLIELLIYLGILTLAVGRIIPIGKLTVIYADIIKELCEFVSASRYSYLSSDGLFIKCLTLAFSILFLLFLILDIKRKRRYLGVISILFVSIFITAFSSAVIRENQDGISYYSDTAIIKSDRKSYAIDSYVNLDDNVSALFYHLVSKNITYLDGFILTSLSYKNEGNLLYLLRKIKVDTLYVPTPKGSYETECAERISAALSLYGTKLEFYEEDENLKLGNVCFNLIKRNYYTPSSLDIETIYSLTYKDKISVYTSELKDTGYKNAFINIALKIDTVILGKGVSEFTFQLPNLKNVYYTADELTYSADYYKEKEASVNKTEAPLDIDFIR